MIKSIRMPMAAVLAVAGLMSLARMVCAETLSRPDGFDTPGRPPNLYASLKNFAPNPLEFSRYHALANAVVGVNQGRFFNRPLYINHEAAFVLAGDLPMVKFASGGTVHGTFLLGLVRGGTTKWLQDCSNILSACQPAHFTWRVTDPAFTNLAVTLEVTALAGHCGFAARATAGGAKAGDRLVWAYGGAGVPGGNLNWELDPYYSTNLQIESFLASACAGNRVEIQTGALAGAFTVRPAGSNAPYTLGRCSVAHYFLADASAWSTPRSLLASPPRIQPIVCGVVPLDTVSSATWSFYRESTLPATLPRYSDPTASFAGGLSRSASLAARLVVDTPEPRLKAEAAAAVAGVDGAWYGKTFHHGAMLWNVPFVGWRTTIGAAMLGWHDRVETEARYYLSKQLTHSTNDSDSADSSRLLTLPARNSRFYGIGYINQDQNFYDMQAQFFDQVLEDWRWRIVENPTYDAPLRIALALHLQRAQECFDPDNNGTYESVINTWPTDAVWFNGGGCSDETAYIYRARLFARELAERAGDSASVAAQNAVLAKIRKAFFCRLWVARFGHPGLYREQGGHHRLNDNPWLYSLCIPIDAGLLTPEQAAETLYYTQWGLQNDAMPAGGRRVWTSNFVPAIWSARELWPGDNYMLALSYFQTGLPDEGWDVLKGTFLQSGFNGLVPGDTGAAIGGTDFGDCVDTFLRAVVEGLFGYQPDYPNDKVRIAPQFPAAWNHASIKTPDVALRYTNSGDSVALSVTLARDAALEVDLPVCASGIANVTVNGQPAAWGATNGFGRTIIRVSAPAISHRVTRFRVTARGMRRRVPPVFTEGTAGAPVHLSVAGAALTSFSDPEGALTGVSASGNGIQADLSTNPGYHTVFARVNVGSLPQTRIFHLHIKPRAGAPTTAFSNVPSDARWSPLDMSSLLTANITSIYQQPYLAPRPRTISTRIGTDGYSPWAFTYWGCSAPAIDTSNVAALLSPTNSGLLVTPQGVPFRWGGTNNVAFTSLWTNWPARIRVSVNQAGEAVWFLVCGSTTILQTRIANAVLRLRYADGVEEQVELVPPCNFWNLAPINGRNTALQHGDSDYTNADEAFSVPKPWPMRVQLGGNCRAMLLNHKLRPGVVLQSVTLETLSQESVVGLMGVTMMNPAGAGTR